MKHIKCKIDSVVDELKTANLSVGKKTPKKVINLFSEQYIIDIGFNGYHDLDSYEIHLQDLYKKCKSQFDRKITIINDYDKMILHLDLAIFEIKQVKNNYLRENSRLLKRIRIEKAYKLNDKYENQVVDMINQFFEIKLQLANNLISFFKHRINILKVYQEKDKLYPLKSNSKRRVVNSNQLTLFPDNNKSPNLKWVRTPTDFMELLHALFCSNSFTSSTGVLTRKDLVDFFSWLFNIKIDDPNGVLRSAKKRKKVSTPFLNELANTFENSVEEMYS